MVNEKLQATAKPNCNLFLTLLLSLCDHLLLSLLPWGCGSDCGVPQIQAAETATETQKKLEHLTATAHKSNNELFETQQQLAKLQVSS